MKFFLSVLLALCTFAGVAHANGLCTDPVYVNGVLQSNKVTCDLSVAPLDQEVLLGTIPKGVYIEATDNSRTIQISYVKALAENGGGTGWSETGVTLVDFLTGQATRGLGEVGGVFRPTGSSAWYPLISWGCNSTGTSCTGGLRVLAGQPIRIGFSHPDPTSQHSYWIKLSNSTTATTSYRFPQWDTPNFCNIQHAFESGSSIARPISTEAQLLQNKTGSTYYIRGATVYAANDVGTLATIDKACYFVYDPNQVPLSSSCSDNFNSVGDWTLPTSVAIPPNYWWAIVATHSCTNTATDARWDYGAWAHITSTP